MKGDQQTKAPASASRLTSDSAFNAVYRRGKWVRGFLLSFGAAENNQTKTRVGLRTRKGMKGAVIRNRLKRQLRAILSNKQLPFRAGLDLVIVIHPPRLPVSSVALEQELLTLCRRNGVLVSNRP